MAKETQKVTREEPVPAPVEVQQVMESNGEAMASVMKSSQAMLAGFSSLSSEMMAFGSTRLKENIEAAGSLGQCTTPAELFRVQCDYAHKATQQYADEASRIIQLASRMTQETWLPLEDRTRETLNSFKSE